MAEPVRLVVWDLDDTFWRGTVTEGGIREYVQEHHDIVIELARRGIMSSICSKNDFATVMAILQEKGIADYFIFPSISWDPKGMRLAQLVEAVQLRAPTIMFIDDNPNNRAEAIAVLPELQVEDESFITCMLEDPRFRGKADPELARLKQYKLLEDRKRDEAKTAGNNETFLRGCNIRVCIEYDITGHIDRAVELINRTNQLNYTKKRLPENPDEAQGTLLQQMRPFDRTAGLVRVVDKYGDYGFIGFFMTGGMRKRLLDGTANTHLVHFCFSCRTLGMLIEHWIYNYLGRPELEIVGDVLTDLSVDRNIDWIRIVDRIDDADVVTKKAIPQIVFVGGCEANAIGLYLNAFTEKLSIHGNYVSNGLFVCVNYADRIIDVCDREGKDILKELQIIGLPPHLEIGDIFAEVMPNTLFILNLGLDIHGSSRIRHRSHDWTFVLSPNNLSGGLRIPAPDGTLAGALDAAGPLFSSAEKDELIRINNHLKEHYEVIGNPDDVDWMTTVREIISRIPYGSKLILIVDHDEVRPSGPGGPLCKVPRVTEYTAHLRALAAEQPYTALITYTDVLESLDEIIGQNHYRREVYLRIAQRIAQVADSTSVRRDAPAAKHRLARITAKRSLSAAKEKSLERRRRESEALVAAIYQCLLRRPPDTTSQDYFVSAMTAGNMSQADFVYAIARTTEFRDKWVAAGLTRAGEV